MIYIIRYQDTVKIGCSEDPVSRIRKIQTNLPERLEILAIIPGGFSEERALHRRFEDEHTNGEWFRYTDKIADFISSYHMRTAANSTIDMTLNRETADRVAIFGNWHLILGITRRPYYTREIIAAADSHPEWTLAIKRVSIDKYEDRISPDRFGWWLRQNRGKPTAVTSELSVMCSIHRNTTQGTRWILEKVPEDTAD
ncbi:MAG: GIY-YIG nuclease family protein [Patescibacteria group bacterium]|nr:GIY-YIG nuclease family protein [Patescibacteria group bacterium]